MFQNPNPNEEEKSGCGGNNCGCNNNSSDNENDDVNQSNKTNVKPITDMEERYKRAYTIVLNKLPVWRQKEIKKLVSNRDFDNRFYGEFINDVTYLAEHEPFNQLVIK